ncbi:hypothetical protein ACHAW5_005405 [Stephanodiscus triporus]|uniref:Uncharacterized protein n=1 Tax=Stephanodiscus triporus TaxID=2934178 RepID=A0ABD3NL39_9STRA
MSRCRARWEEEDRERRDDNDEGASDDDECDGGLATASRRIVSPDQVADWAMSSWTAMLLLRGLDRPVSRCNHLGVGVDVGGVIDPVEGRLAALLSDRRDGDARSAATTSTTTLARAVKRRIDFLLSPANISSLNGIHLYSLGRLLASFSVRDDAMMHVVLSVCRCGIAAMGSGGRGEVGLVGLEQLSRLLAVFACCCTSASSTTTAAATSTSVNAVSIVRDLEIGLRAKLEDDKLVRTIMADSIADERGGGGGGADLRTEKRVQRKYHLVKSRAMSFMDAVLSATAHLVKCCEK